MRTSLMLLCGLFLMNGCRAAPPASDPPAPVKGGSLSDQVARLTMPHCGSCHTGSSPEADQACLKVFDYEKDWVSMLSRERVDKFKGRAMNKLDPEGQKILQAWAAQTAETSPR